MKIILPIIGLMFSSLTAMSADLSCEEILKSIVQPPVESSHSWNIINSNIRPSWESSNFTDPNHSVDDNYMYIIRVGSLEKVTSQLSSASLISQNFNGVYYSYPWAYILKIPKENIVATSPEDSGRGSTSSDGGAGLSESVLNGWSAYLGVHTPEGLIKESLQVESKYNEILFRPYRLISNLDHSSNVEYRAEMIGIVYFPNKKFALGDGSLPGEQVFKTVQQESARLGLPIVTIKLP